MLIVMLPLIAAPSALRIESVLFAPGNVLLVITMFPPTVPDWPRAIDPPALLRKVTLLIVTPFGTSAIAMSPVSLKF